MPNSFLRRFQVEQLEADLDLRLSDVVVQDTSLTVRGRAGGVRLMFAAIFILPGLWLGWQALSTLNPLILITALILCPVLFAVGILFGFLTAGKSFDITRHVATNSLRLFNFRTERTIDLPSKGTVKLWSEWHMGGEGPGCWWHNVALDGCNGFSFTISRDYTRARVFAEQLARSLRYGLTDVTEPRSR